MTTAPADSGQSPGDLTVRIFRALYQEFDLHMINGIYIVVPKGAQWFAGPSLGDIARQINGDATGPVCFPDRAGMNTAITPSAKSLPHRRVGGRRP